MTRIAIYMRRNKISIYRLSKETGIAYASLHDIVSGKTDLKNIRFEYAMKIASALRLSGEDLIDMDWEIQGRRAVSPSGTPFTWIQDADSDCIETTIGDRRLILPILTDCTIFHKECGLYDWYAGCLIDHLKESYAFTGDLDQSVRNVFEAEDRAAGEDRKNVNAC